MAGYYFEVFETVKEPEPKAIYEGKMADRELVYRN